MTAPAFSDVVSIERHPDRPGATRLTARQWLPRPIEPVFEFFADAGNLEAITPPWLRFRIVTPLPIEMRAGAIIAYRLRLHGVPFGWRTEISEWSAPSRFVDRQLRGPYHVWIHEHTFEPCNGGTEVRDTVTYVARGGRLVDALFVRRDLRAIFRFRQERIRSLLGELSRGANGRE